MIKIIEFVEIVMPAFWLAVASFAIFMGAIDHAMFAAAMAIYAKIGLQS